MKTPPTDKQISEAEYEAYFAPRQEENNVGDNPGTTDNHDSVAALESEQTADLEENDRQRAEKLWNDGWQSGHRAGYRDAVEDANEAFRKEQNYGDD